MIMKALQRAALVLLFAVVVSPALAADVSGVYVGTYTASQLPGRTLKISLTFMQNGTALTGTYTTSSGVQGIGHGTLANGTAQMSWQNTTTTCPGNYQGPYTFANRMVTWTYTGEDCLGPEQGAGTANWVSPF